MSDWNGESQLNQGLEAAWIQIQKKTFTRWANTYLKERMLSINDLATDLSDGVQLINLLEIISSKSVNNNRWNKKPKIRSQMLENNLFALNFLKDEGIKLVNIGNEDIVDCKLKLILGLIWTIILRYQINIEEGKSARSELLEWVRKQIPEYKINNFSKDWNDGRAICALGNSLKPGICPNHWDLPTGDALSNATLGTDIAERELEIPKVLAPQDMINPEVDELSVMTYISYFRDWEANQRKKKSLEELERTAIPEKCRAFGPGWDKAETGIPTEFTIEAINANNRRVPQGGDVFDVSIKGPNKDVPIEVTDNGDGTYLVRYTPTEVGRQNMSIKLKDKHISNSPKTLQVSRGGPDASQCRAYGPGLEGGVAGEPGRFTIESVNRHGNPIPEGGDPYVVKVEGPYKVDLPVDIIDNKDGTYSVTYRPLDHGNHVINITLNGQPVAKSPYHVTIDKNQTDADASHTVAYGPGLEGGSTSEPAEFTVETRNSQGVRLASGGSPVDVDIHTPSGNDLPAKIVDNKDGTYTVSYQPTEPGVHVVDVVLRNKHTPLYYEHIQNSPFKVTIEAGTDAGKSTAYGPGLKDGIPDTLPTHFTIQAKDRDGKEMKKGGDPFQVKIQGPNGPVDADIKDNGDGTYTVNYQPKEAGKHKIDVTLKDKPISNSPYTVNVKEGADDEHSFVEGYTFTIRARSKKNTDRKDGGDDFKVVIHGPSGDVQGVTVKDIGDGTYFVSYKLPESGEYSVDVLLNGKHIKGSPWKQQI